TDKQRQTHKYKQRDGVKRTNKDRRSILNTMNIERIVNREINVKLDKKNLNEMSLNPTMERISVWIWNKLKPTIKELHEVRVWENRKKGTSVIYRENGPAQS